MTDLQIKIKNQKNKKEENGKKWVIYELEEKVEYGDNDYSEIKLEYDRDKQLERLQVGKDITLQIFADNKTRKEGDILVIPQRWNAKKTLLQDIKDKSNQGLRDIGDKTGSDALKNAATAGKYWWVLPVTIFVSMIIFGLMIYWALRGITRKDE